MRKIFLDIGAGAGTSAEYFLKTHKGFEIYSFECDKRNIETIKQKGTKTNLITCAAWISDNIVRYYPGTTSGAGTLFKTKKTGGINKNKYYDVPAVDLARFIKSKFSRDDYIIVKLNCEGSEYELIPHLRQNNLVSWVNEWFVNWHYKKIGMSEDEHNMIVGLLPDYKTWRPC
jgi:FkbM family methyltransferase